MTQKLAEIENIEAFAKENIPMTDFPSEPSHSPLTTANSVNKTPSRLPTRSPRNSRVSIKSIRSSYQPMKAARYGNGRSAAAGMDNSIMDMTMSRKLKDLGTR